MEFLNSQICNQSQPTHSATSELNATSAKLTDGNVGNELIGNELNESGKSSVQSENISKEAAQSEQSSIDVNQAEEKSSNDVGLIEKSSIEGVQSEKSCNDVGQSVEKTSNDVDQVENSSNDVSQSEKSANEVVQSGTVTNSRSYELRGPFLAQLELLRLLKEKGNDMWQTLLGMLLLLKGL